VPLNVRCARRLQRVARRNRATQNLTRGCSPSHELQLRGLAFGIISSPYIITVSIDCLDFPVAIRQLTAVFVRSTVQPWFTAEIADHFISTGNWRWGYGVSTDCLSTAQRPQADPVVFLLVQMFSILMPAVILPATFLMMYLERRAKKEGILNVASSSAARRRAKEHAEANGVELGLEGGQALHLPAYEVPDKAPFMTRFWSVWHELDTNGLILLGFGWALVRPASSLDFPCLQGRC
jgi:hypothetical protein